MVFVVVAVTAFLCACYVVIFALCRISALTDAAVESKRAARENPGDGVSERGAHGSIMRGGAGSPRGID